MIDERQQGAIDAINALVQYSIDTQVSFTGTKNGGMDLYRDIEPPGEHSADELLELLTQCGFFGSHH